MFTENQDEICRKKKRNYECEICGKLFKTRTLCNTHTKRVHLAPNKTIQCNYCKDRFSSSNKLKKHIDKIHHANKSFDDDFQLTQPKKNEPQDTGDYTLEQWNEIVLSKSKECPVCHKMYANPKCMRKHLREVHSSQKKFVCDVCGKQFTSTNRVTQHKQKNHWGINKILEKKFECDLCNLKFRCKFFLEEHINTHTGNKPYQCEICKKSFANIRGYKRDLKRHKQLAGELKNEELHECKICNKFFLESSRLMKHLQWVHGDKCHVCKVCGRKIKGSIQKHMLSHTGEKPYCCHICGKSYKGNLKDHMLTHTGERPFKCDICGSAFKDKWYLGVHRRKHTGEKPYECNFCGQFFAARSTFTAHLKKHDDKIACTKSYTCQICKLRFDNEVTLSSHYSEHFALNPV